MGETADKLPVYNATLETRAPQQQVEKLAENATTDYTVGVVRATARNILDGADTATITKRNLETFKTTRISIKLETKYGEGLTIKSCELSKEDIEAIGQNVLTLWKDGKLQAYINQNGEVLVDIINFDIKSRKNLLFVNIDSGMHLKDGKLIYKASDGEFYEEGHKYFNSHIIKFYIMDY
ncbi:MAG: hypothetical protein N4A38_04350 [Candidatus Gracilibacteria bacterium]|nr:hypothetical protein [Candidatus Gracilibacteria bacterium]